MGSTFRCCNQVRVYDHVLAQGMQNMFSVRNSIAVVQWHIIVRVCVVARVRAWVWMLFPPAGVCTGSGVSHDQVLQAYNTMEMHVFEMAEVR